LMMIAVDEMPAAANHFGLLPESYAPNVT
jgi:hypothetical protein